MDKKTVHKAFSDLLQSRIAQSEAMMSDIGDSTQNETKSSAGDKFETSREMLQQEEDKIKGQLEKLYFQKKELRALRDIEATDKISWGSLVDTDRGAFYISTSLGKVELQRGGMIYAISKVSPMAQVLFGKQAGERAMLLDRQIQIISLF